MSCDRVSADASDADRYEVAASELVLTSDGSTCRWQPSRTPKSRGQKLVTADLERLRTTSYRPRSRRVERTSYGSGRGLGRPVPSEVASVGTS